jgi:hypothetical protein
LPPSGTEGGAAVSVVSAAATVVSVLLGPLLYALRVPALSEQRRLRDLKDACDKGAWVRGE